MSFLYVCSLPPPLSLINALEKLHSDSIIKANFYCVFLTSVTQRGSKVELMWLEEQGGRDLFIMSGWRRILVFSEIKRKDSTWFSNESLVSIRHMGRWGSDWQCIGVASNSETREKVSRIIM